CSSPKLFRSLHYGLFLFPFLSMDGCCQVHKRNGLTTAGLLFQLGHCRLLWAVIDDTVDHAVIIFHRHFRISQRIFRQETLHLGETNTVAVMTGYLTILL